jgi:hypothetical protein
MSVIQKKEENFHEIPPSSLAVRRCGFGAGEV